MSTSTARVYRSNFAGRFMPSETRKSPQNRAFYGHRDTYSGKAHCIKDSVLIDKAVARLIQGIPQKGLISGLFADGRPMRSYFFALPPVR